MKNSNEHSLKEVINELLQSYKLQDGIYESRLLNSWEKVVGKMIARHTQNLFIKKETLFVKLDSSALKHELSFAKSKLIISLNKTVGKEVIQEIVLI